MITAIEIENFKGIRERVRLDFRPITMFFGGNSAGKSSVFHALHYAREVFERHNLDADRTIAGGDHVDLGGFKEFVHNHDMSKTVILGIEFYSETGSLESELEQPLVWGEQSLIREPALIKIVAEITWSQQLERAFCNRYTLYANLEPLLTIDAVPGRPYQSAKINRWHPSLVTSADCDSILFKGDDDDEPAVAIFGSGDRNDPDNFSFDLVCGDDAIPRVDRSLYAQDRAELTNPQLIEIYQARMLLLHEPLRLACEQLANIRHIGPLRQTPPRNFKPDRYPNRSRWISGIGAWEALQNGDDNLVKTVGDWLGEEDKLNCGYRVERKRFKEIDLSHPLIVKLLTGRAFDDADEHSQIDLIDKPTQSRVVVVPNGTELELQPHDVGIGISQIVPVVVAAVDGHNLLLAIEQPELHLHPRLQAELADLFIEAALGEQHHQVLIETHSELIPLRIMRRIRESFHDKVGIGRRKIASHDISIVYLESFQGATVATTLELSKEGKLLDPWPEGFFEEGFRERFSE